MNRHIKAYRANGETIFETDCRSLDECNAIFAWYQANAGKTANGVFGIMFHDHGEMYIQIEGNTVYSWAL